MSAEGISIYGSTAGIARRTRAFAAPVACVVAALAITAILLLALGADPLFAYRAMVVGSVGSEQAISATLAKTVPICLIGLGVLLTFRCGLWNIGGEGQFYSGAIGAALTGILVSAPAPILITLELLGAAAAGALTAYVPAVLKSRFHANEILVTLMLNYVPLYLALYLIQGPFSQGLAAKTVDIHPAGELPWLVVGGLRIHAGVLFVVAAVLATHILVSDTAFGFKIRAIGSNPHAAAAAGINVARYQFRAFIVAGAFSGLAGAIQVTAIHHNLLEGISSGFGFTAIVAALLGRLHSLGVLLASFGFAALLVGGDSMQRTAKIESSTVFVIEGLILLFLLAGRIIGREGAHIH